MMNRHLFFKKFLVAFSIVALVGCSTSFTSEVISQVVDRSSDRGKDRILIYIQGESRAPDLTKDQEIQTLIRNNYYFETVRLSYGYDDGMFREVYTRNKGNGNWRSSLTYEEYLLRRNNPYSMRDLEVIKYLGLRQTPELVVLDSQGRILDHYTAMTSDPHFRHLIQRGAFSSSSNLTEEQIEVLLWSLEDDNDREDLIRFLRKNAL